MKMEEAYECFKHDGKNTLDGLIQWMKDAKIIDGEQVTEDKAKEAFQGVDPAAVDLDKFKEALDKLAKDTNQDVNRFQRKLCKTGSVLEQAFEKLKKDGNNTVDNLVQWMKQSKVIDASKEADEKARKLFDDCADKANVEYTKFKDVVTKLATDLTTATQAVANAASSAQQSASAGVDEAKIKTEQVIKMLAEKGPKLASAFGAAASAFSNAMKK